MNSDVWSEKEKKTLERLLTKGKKGILRAVFGRTTLVILLLVIQVLLLFSFFNYLANYIPFYVGGTTIFTAIMMVYILNSNDNPTVKLTWAVVIALAPVPGALFYKYVQLDIGHRAEQALLQKVEQDTRPYAAVQQELMDKLDQEDKRLSNLARYTQRVGSFPVYTNTDVEYYSLGEHKFAAMLREIEKAKHFVFLEYFAIDKGVLWSQLIELLSRKVKEGVEVRLIYDGTNSLFALPAHYPKELAKLGIRCKVFSPIRPMITTSYNNRDHRKILVVDGHTAITGGVNLADEYINQKEVYGHWKDTAVLLRGDAVRSFTLMFLQMWNAAEPEPIYEPYLKAPGECGIQAPGYVLPYGDSPMDDEQLGEMVYLDILNQAKDYVYIMTPYLILDHEMLTALTYAAKRGVDVRLILPHIPDKEYAFVLAKTHYKELTAAGVKIFEYTPGFVHAKVFLSDDSRAVVGTINLDYRSLYLHFECAAYLQDVPALKEIKQDFIDTEAKSQPVTMETIRKEKLRVRAAGAMLKVLAPLM